MKYHQAPERGPHSRERDIEMIMDIFHYLQARLTVNMKSERGAALVEYALLLALIAVVCIVAIGAIGTKANTKFNSIGSSLG